MGKRDDQNEQDGQDEQKVAACIRILEEQYGLPRAEIMDPVDLLVMTILSQNTSDTNSLRAFGNLKEAFADYELTQRHDWSVEQGFASDPATRQPDFARAVSPALL